MWWVNVEMSLKLQTEMSFISLLLTSALIISMQDNGVFPKGFTDSTIFSDKNISHYNKRARTYHPDTSCVADHDATTALARHMWEIGSLNWSQFILQWFGRFPEFAEFSKSSAHLGKTLLTWQCNLLHILFFQLIDITQMTLKFSR